MDDSKSAWPTTPTVQSSGADNANGEAGSYYLQLSRLLIEVNCQLDAHAQDRNSAGYANELKDLREAMSDSLTLAMLIAQQFKIEQAATSRRISAVRH